MPLNHPPPPASRISQWLYVHTELLWVLHREIEPQYLDAPYFAENRIAAWLVETGEASVTTGKGVCVARPNQWLFPGLTPGRMCFRPGTTTLSVRFSAEWPTGEILFDHREAFHVPEVHCARLTRAGKTLAAIVRRVSHKEGFFWLQDTRAPLSSYFHIRLAFEKWLSAYVETMLALDKPATVPNQMDERVLRAARLIDTRPVQLALSETELARMVGLSLSQLNRLFAKQLGITPKKYFERRRLEKAIILLSEKTTSIKEAAYELGFSSLPHFSAWFTRHGKVSPTEFRKRKLRE